MTTNNNLPAIPTRHTFEYKHYFITKDRQTAGKYNLYLFRYEPVSCEVYGENNMAVYQKYGKSISYMTYSWQPGQENWGSGLSNTTIALHYEDFAETLVYNNFVMNFGKDHYEAKPMPEDGVTAGSEPEFPAIPKINDNQYKYYYIIQDKKVLQRYYLYLLAYKPVSMELYGPESIVAYQKYGKTISCRLYSYEIGATAWTLSSSNSSILQNRNEFMNALVYNNFTIDFDNQYYGENPMPGDDVVPPAKPDFPEIPTLHNVQYKHYYIVQNKDVLERYYLYMLMYEPASMQEQSGALIAYQKYGRLVSSRVYVYDVGQSQWAYSTANNTAIQAYADFTDALQYNNFTIDLKGIIYKKNPLSGDGVAAASEPEYPKIPKLHDYQYKHYYIVQSKDSLEKYYLYMLMYEPSAMKVQNNAIIAYQKYDRLINSRVFVYTVGKDTWDSYTSNSSTIQGYVDFSDALQYNNFTINLNNDQYDENPLPDDGVEASPELRLPQIPKLHDYQYKQYYIVQSKDTLEKYYLYMLRYEPSLMKLQNNAIVAYQKYDMLIESRIFTYTVGKETWDSYATNSGVIQSYNDFTDALQYNNFTIDINDNKYERNPLSDDGVIAAPKLQYPKVPELHNFRYKHYYIVQDKKMLERYYLYVLMYEPDSMQIQGTSIMAYQKYGRVIASQIYTYDIGQESWKYNTTNSNAIQAYAGFAETLQYNNFNIDLGNVSYEKNPLPEDGVVKAIKPHIPELPNLHSFRYKHYYIVQDKNQMETYRLFLFMYEPESIQINESDGITAYQKYGRAVRCEEYTYTVGEDKWKYYSWNNSIMQNYNYFRDALLYNNFVIDMGEEHHEKNPLPHDGIVPAPTPVYPQIMYDDVFKYKHYYIVQDKNNIEIYHLFAFMYKPDSLEVNNSFWISAFQEYGRPIRTEEYTYTVGEDKWKLGTWYSTTFHHFDNFRDALVYNNFTFNLKDRDYYENSQPEDGITPSLEPEFPKIPDTHNFKNKHYYITRNKNQLETYHMFIFAYEPAMITVNDSGWMSAKQEYGKDIRCEEYLYTVGSDSWRYSTWHNSTYQHYNNFEGSLVYNNFNIRFADTCFGKNKAPGDDIVPAISVEFPQLPKVETEEISYTDYMIFQDPNALEKYTLYLLEKRPADYVITGADNKFVRYMDGEGNDIRVMIYYFTAGEPEWKYSTYTSSLNISINMIAESAMYHNFDILILNSKSVERMRTQSESYTEIDRVSVTVPLGNVDSTNGWYTEVIKDKVNVYYMKNGKKQSGWITDGGKRYYLAFWKKDVRLENVGFIDFTDRDNYTNYFYYFDENGAMVTGPYSINGRTHIFDENGRFQYIEESDRIFDKYVANDRLRIRNSPNGLQVDGKITFMKGAIVRTHSTKESKKIKNEDGTETTWVKVYYKGNNVGWVSKSILDELPEPISNQEFMYDWDRSDYVTTDFKDKVAGIAAHLGIDPDDLMAVMAYESYFNPAQEPVGGGQARGLIQFQKDVAEELDTKTEYLETMTGVEQLDYVYGRFYPVKGRMKKLSDIYMRVFCPKALEWDEDETLYLKGTKEYESNKSVDVDGDGKITKREATQRVINESLKYTVG